MARQGRIDYPGAVQHIMLRGIERKNIFGTDPDKEDFLRRLEKSLIETQTQCFAFALMSNHAHLLLQTGSTPVSKIMQSLQTGYAVSYNLRHNRTGKLYQNRFKSVLCDKEEYLLQLVRYIHLNPLKAVILDSMRKLDKDRWTTHSVYMKKRNREWINTEEVLLHFGRTEGEARKEYRKFIQAGLETEDTIDFDGGGLIRSLGGYWETRKQQKKKNRRKEAADERILGSGEFVEEVLKANEEKEVRSTRLKREGWGFEKVLKKAADGVDLKPEELLQSGRANARSEGRGLLSKWLVVDLKMKQKEVAEKLGVGRSAIPYLVNKGRQVEKRLGVSL